MQRSFRIAYRIVISGTSVVILGGRATSFANFVTRFVFSFLLGDILKDEYSKFGRDTQKELVLS